METTSITLLERVRQSSDQKAWEQFVSLYTPFLYTCAQRAGLNPQDARELVQDVLVHLLNELPKFRYDNNRGSFRGWLRTVTVNKCRERRRKRILATSDEPLPDMAAVEQEAFWEVEHRDFVVRRAMDIMRTEFETNTWRAFCEFITSGRKAAEIAAELEMTEAAVYMAKSRVLRRLRQELSGLIE